ncbi:hypothetical protein OIU79_001320 [Salix purpurea]|uniref:Uncharacterized protein n=1 Tax=Salix purpurea TaxID=77065 RepID=A0A9Q0V3B6_SALPP|nr:hypothetical protein OIU79_001320 [Salix purpurea]
MRNEVNGMKGNQCLHLCALVDNIVMWHLLLVAEPSLLLAGKLFDLLLNYVVYVCRCSVFGFYSTCDAINTEFLVSDFLLRCASSLDQFDDCEHSRNHWRSELFLVLQVVTKTF